MNLFTIYCAGCMTPIAEAYAEEDSDVAKGHTKDAYYCADCAEEDK